MRTILRTTRNIWKKLSQDESLSLATAIDRLAEICLKTFEQVPEEELPCASLIVLGKTCHSMREIREQIEKMVPL